MGIKHLSYDTKKPINWDKRCILIANKHLYENRQTISPEMQGNAEGLSVGVGGKAFSTGRLHDTKLNDNLTINVSSGSKEN